MKILNPQINLDDFFTRVHTGESLLMLDYDGTLAPFVKERMKAFPYPGIKERLEKLTKLKNTKTVIISGRSLADLEHLLDMSSKMELWGSHGIERKLCNGEKKDVKLEENLYKGLKLGIEACQKNGRQEWCEVKPYSVALHWRGVHPDEQFQALKLIKKAWEKICTDYSFEIYHFDGGIELRTKGWNKKNAIEKLLNERQGNASMAYLGDDLTDEDAFAALGNKGLKVLVREEFRPTLADIHLTPPEELLTFLDRWIKND